MSGKNAHEMRPEVCDTFLDNTEMYQSIFWADTDAFLFLDPRTYSTL